MEASVEQILMFLGEEVVRTRLLTQELKVLREQLERPEPIRPPFAEEKDAKQG